ncbi:helix-turn-helix domain protein [Acidithrix ferrooxidans]|uniref:Helix-turn-helix domain protein n=2 Tax=Acidithrix ferrooxidans TaxID=1280514 RepID=A0A0D8HJN9_9ACTN|nr:helix-turn-helix domain protein [Acidithrix ferrooxidans]
MDGDADIATVAALMGEPSRAAVLVALADGRALAASTLAVEAGVAPSTLSGHLARLVDGGLISVEPSGRHRYFRLAAPEVAQAVEALARVAPSRPIRSLRQATHASAIRQARTCYDHLAGRLGVAICDSLLNSEIVRVETNPGMAADPIVGAGRSNQYVITEYGKERLKDLGVELDQSSRRPLVLYCLDWSEQRPHLGGRLGAALLNRFIVLGWMIQADRRVIRITKDGQTGLCQEFAIDTVALQ